MERDNDLLDILYIITDDYKANKHEDRHHKQTLTSPTPYPIHLPSVLQGFPKTPADALTSGTKPTKPRGIAAPAAQIAQHLRSSPRRTGNDAQSRTRRSGREAPLARASTAHGTAHLPQGSQGPTLALLRGESEERRVAVPVARGPWLLARAASCKFPAPSRVLARGSLRSHMAMRTERAQTSNVRTLTAGVALRPGVTRNLRE